MHTHDEIRTSSDEILSLWLKMKLNPPYPSPREAGFHREAISSTAGGFLPRAADLVEKKHICIADVLFFMAEREGFEPSLGY